MNKSNKFSYYKENFKMKIQLKIYCIICYQFYWIVKISNHSIIYYFFREFYIIFINTDLLTHSNLSKFYSVFKTFPLEYFLKL